MQLMTDYETSSPSYYFSHMQLVSWDIYYN